MTLKSFYRAFRKAAPQFKWLASGDIWSDITDSSGFTACPITAVYRIRTGNHDISIGDFDIVGPKLGLSKKDIGLIVEAADGDFSILDRRTKIVRKALLRAIGRGG